jgi:hypothetical protein
MEKPSKRELFSGQFGVGTQLGNWSAIWWEGICGHGKKQK